MHRIGFHFPSVVVAQVCAHYGIVLTSAGTVLVEDESHSFHPRPKRLKEQAAAHELKDQITINTEARDTMRDLFPNIPDNDLNQIIKTAFQKGQGKVGTASELSLIRRAQLAVVAHIRHVYTDYDKLLRQTHYREARNLVEKPTLRKLVEWRGDDEDGKKVLEDVFREVVVISDDEDSGEEEDEAMNQVRDVSVEVVSSNTKADHFDPDPPVLEYPAIRRRPDDPHSGRRRPSHYEYIAAPSRNEQPKNKDKSSRRGFSRYQAWNEAREQYRANPTDALVINERPVAFAAPETAFPRDTHLSESGYLPEPSEHPSRKPYTYQVSLQAFGMQTTASSLENGVQTWIRALTRGTFTNFSRTYLPTLPSIGLISFVLGTGLYMKGLSTILPGTHNSYLIDQWCMRDLIQLQQER